MTSSTMATWATFADPSLGPWLRFDPVRHAYWYEHANGRVEPLPGVTTVLRGVNLIDLSRIPDGNLEAARDRGHRVHQAAHYLTEGTLDWSTVGELEKPYVEAYARFLADSKFEVLRQESWLHQPIHRFAGTCDAVGYWQGHPAVGDLKSGDPDLVGARYQLAAYESCLRAVPPLEWLDFAKSTPILRVSIALRRDGTYKPEIYRDATDHRVWLAALTVYRAITRKGNL